MLIMAMSPLDLMLTVWGAILGILVAGVLFAKFGKDVIAKLKTVDYQRSVSDEDAIFIANGGGIANSHTVTFNRRKASADKLIAIIKDRYPSVKEEVAGTVTQQDEEWGDPIHTVRHFLVEEKSGVKGVITVHSYNHYITPKLAVICDFDTAPFMKTEEGQTYLDIVRSVSVRIDTSTCKDECRIETIQVIDEAIESCEVEFENVMPVHKQTELYRMVVQNHSPVLMSVPMKFRRMSGSMLNASYPDLRFEFGGDTYAPDTTAAVELFAEALSKGQNVGILGSTGVGKTNLAHHVLDRAGALGCKVVMLEAGLLRAIQSDLAIRTGFLASVAKLSDDDDSKIVFFIDEAQSVATSDESETTTALLQLMSGTDQQMLNCAVLYALNKAKKDLPESFVRAGRSFVVAELGALNVHQAQELRAQIQRNYRQERSYNETSMKSVVKQAKITMADVWGCFVVPSVFDVFRDRILPFKVGPDGKKPKQQAKTTVEAVTDEVTVQNEALPA